MTKEKYKNQDIKSKGVRTNRWTSRVNTKKILYTIYKIVVTNYNAKTFNEDCLMVIAS